MNESDNKETGLMNWYTIHYGWGGTKISRASDEEAIAFARKWADKRTGRRPLIVRKVDREETRILKEQR